MPSERRITLDFESYSEADLKKVGAWKYWQHPSTEPIMLSGVWEGGEAIWVYGEPFPEWLRRAIEEGWILDCHNASFEQAAWLWCVRHLDWPEAPPYRWDDTMARAAALALPLSLDEVGRALHLRVQKDKAGKQWLQKFTRPKKATKKIPQHRTIQTPEDWGVGKTYCLIDGRTEHGLRRRIGTLSARERAVWEMDQRINQRGIQVDMKQVRAARAIVEQVEAKLSRELEQITKGEVHSATQVTALIRWLAKNGCPIEDLRADTVLDARTCGIWKGTPVQRVLDIRQTLAKASTKKLNAFENAVCSDGRVRYMFQYAGATQTARWAGRLVQLQNLPRLPAAMEGYDPEVLAAAIGTADMDYLDSVYGDAMTTVSAGLRGMLIPGRGKKFVAGDLRSIEAVGLAGLAGCESKLDIFRQGGDPYCSFASRVLGFPITKKSHPFERQTIGKPGELAFGYGGGVGAWRKFDDSDRFDDDRVNEFKDIWREQHVEVEQLWHGLETAAIRAVMGTRSEYNGIAYEYKQNFLVCTLPSGRNICYYDPQLLEKEMPWSTPEKPVFRPVLTYMSKKNGKWQRVTTWGGKLAENVTQAACRDVLVVGMFNAEDYGLPVILHVHDELVTEVDEANDSAISVLSEAMSQKQPWFAHWPVGVDAWEGLRYRK